MAIWIFLLCLPVLLATPSRVRTYPQAHFRINEIAEGPDGLLYLASDSGLHSFDGFRYTRIATYPFPVAYEVATTRGGVLWAGSKIHGIAYRQRHGSFRVVLPEPYQFATGVSRFMVVQTMKNKIIRIDETGASRVMSFPDPMQPAVSGDEVWLNYFDQRMAFRFNPERMQMEVVPGVHGANFRVVQDSTATIWALHEKGVRAFRNGREVVSLDAVVTGRHPLLAGRSGQVWFQDHDRIRGLVPPVQFRIGSASRAALFEDSRGHLWAGSTEGWLFEISPEAGSEHWPTEDLEDEAPKQFFRDNAGGLICVTQHHLFRFSVKDARWHKFSAIPREYVYVLPLQSGELLASDRGLGLARFGGDGRLREVISGWNQPQVRTAYRKLALGPNGEVLVGHRLTFFKLEEGLLRPSPLPDVSGESQANDFERDADGRLWVGYESGLAMLQTDGSWRRLQTDFPLQMVRSFGMVGDEFWVAHRLTGYFSRVLKNGKVTRFPVDRGYEPADTAFLKVDRRGWIWRGTSKGVYVSNGRETNAEDWLFLETGSCESHYGFYEDRDGTVWIASNSGVTHLRPEASWFVDTGIPKISRVQVGEEVLEDIPPDLARTRRMQVEFSRLGSPNLRPQPIRYRLAPLFDEWRVASDGRVEISDLNPDTYHLEVKQAGSPEVLRRSFRWNKPPPPISYGWLALIAALVIGCWSYTQRELLAYRLGKWTYLVRMRFQPAQVPGLLEERTGQLLHRRYRLIGLVSRSGFADIYEAKDEQNGSRLVVKVVHHRSADAGWIRARFAQEVAALHSVQHRFVIPLLDSWIQSSGEPCLAFPLIEGDTLRDAISNRSLQVETAARLIEDLGDALAALHRAGVIHRDFKPENIMLRPDGTPVLIDLGSSGLLGSEEASAVTRILAGSIDYLAPERLTGCYSPASDIYSFAATVFELLTGGRFSETNLIPAAADFSQQLANRLDGSLPRATIALLAEALASLPERRPQDAAIWARLVSRTLVREHGTSA